jgi:choline kinase
MKAVILAAGVGSRLQPFTQDRPKALVDVKGRPLLFRTLDRLAEVGITGSDVIIVAGYRQDVLRARLDADGRRVTVVYNEKYEEWNNFWSLYVAREAVGGSSFLQLDGDVLFDGAVLPRMLAASGDALLAVDVRPELDPETMKVAAKGPERRITAISKKLDPRGAVGEYIGITRIDQSANEVVFEELHKLSVEGLTNEYYEYAYDRLTRAALPFHAIDVGDCAVTEIDDVADLRRAERMVDEAREVA